MMNLFENLQLMKEAEEHSYNPNNYIWDGKSEVPKDVVNVTIKDGVTEIGNTAFYNRSSLQKINIPNSVTLIGNRAFAYCASLQNINIPDSVTEIGYNAFAYCPNIKVYQNGKLIIDGKSNDNDDGKSNDYDNNDDDYDTNSDAKEILSVVNDVFRNLYLNDQDNMDEEEFNNLKSDVRIKCYYLCLTQYFRLIGD